MAKKEAQSFDFNFDTAEDFFSGSPNFDGGAVEVLEQASKEEVITSKGDTTKLEQEEIATSDDTEVVEDDSIFDGFKEKSPITSKKSEGGGRNRNTISVIEDEDGEDSDNESTAKAKVKKDEEDSDTEEDSEESSGDVEKLEVEKFTSFSEDLKSRGFFRTYEHKDGEKINEDRFFDMIEEEVEGRVEADITEFAESLKKDETKALIKHLEKGGSVSDFIEVYGKVFEIPDFDENNEDHITKAITHYLRTVEKAQNEDIEDRIDYYKSKGSLKNQGKKFYSILQQQAEEEKAALAEEDSRRKNNLKRANEKFNNDLSDTLNKVESVGSFTVTPKDKKELMGFITKSTVNIGGNKAVPEFYFKLNQMINAKDEASREKLIVLAKLLKDDFKAPDMEKVIRSKVVQKTKSKLGQNLGVSGARAGSSSKRQLADFFNED